MSLFIDLSSIEENITRIKSITKKDIMAVIKDNAYGIGSKKILELLKKSNVKWIVYNKYSEYIKDIKYNSDFKILILESIKNIKSFICNDSIYYSVNDLDDALYIKDINRNINIHIQVDVGMNREGIKDILECDKVIKILLNNNNINIDGIYTHFSSDVDDYITYNNEKNIFNKYLMLFKFNNVHSAATSSLHKNILGNMVRFGIGLYGYGNYHLKLNPSINFNCNIIKIFNLNKGNYLGYHKTYKAKKDELIAVLDIGYSDILNILYLSDNLNNKYFVVGKPCMNHMFVRIDNENNNITRLNVLSKNDIISNRNNNWYQILMSIRNVPKNYIRRSNYDISIVYQRTNKKNKKLTIRRRSN